MPTRRNFRERRKQRREEALERLNNPRQGGKKLGLKEKIKKGELSALDALKFVNASSKTYRWIMNRLNRKATPPPGKFHSNDGYDRAKEKHDEHKLSSEIEETT